MSQDLTYLQLKYANEARQSEETRQAQQKKDILVLILDHLREEGYLNSMQCLERESGLSLQRHTVCDNVDLSLVIQEYEAYHFVKFRKFPKISKKVSSSGDGGSGRSGNRVHAHQGTRLQPIPVLDRRPRDDRRGSGGVPSKLGGSSKKGVLNVDRLPVDDRDVKPALPPQIPQDRCGSPALSRSDLVITGNRQINNGHGQIIDMRSLLKNAIGGIPDVSEPISHEEKLLKPIAGFAGYSGEMKELAEVISKEIYVHNPNVHWDDIIGLDDSKRLVKEAIVWPIKYPKLFTGLLSPWRGLLLYGPPGTGKTLLAKAVATECQTTFFNISASTIVSKWRGDSEKLVKVLFELARYHAPSTIFLDELDSVMSARGSTEGMGEHEGSRRMKTELLVQMEGLLGSTDNVFVLAASNLPWELDLAMLRRLEKRILVDLPKKSARCEMLKHYLPPHLPAQDGGLTITSELDYDQLAELTDGYSGSDIKLVCKETAMRPVRKIFDKLEQFESSKMTSFPELVLDAITMSDFKSTLAHTKPSARKVSERYQEFKREFESC